MTAKFTNNFHEAIFRAKQRGHNALAARIEMERKMISALVRHALNVSMTVSVNDGEEWTLVKSSNYAAIFDALFTTDEDIIMLRDASGEKVGSFMLIYGNDGYDVIADYTTNEQTDHIWNTVIEPLADRLEKEARA